MTRADLALLVFRTLALWIGSSGLIFALAALTPLEGDRLVVMGTVGGGLGMLAIGLAVWAASPWLARTTFGASDAAVGLSITPHDVPPLACFVVGLLQVASAIPQAFGWIAVSVTRYREAGLLSSATDVARALDERAVVAGAEVIASLIVGVTLIVLSRRETLWTSSPPDPDPSR